MTTMRRTGPCADRIKKKLMYLCYVLVALSLLLPLSLSAETEAEVHAACRASTEAEKPAVRLVALKGLSLTGKPNDAAKFREARILDQNQEIAAAAIEAIGNFGGPTTIQTLIRVKKANPAHPLLSHIHDVLKKNKAGKQYSLLSTSLNFTQQPDEQAASHGIPGENEVVEVIERGKRKYTYLSSTGQEYEDFWYKVKDFKDFTGRTG